MAPRIRRSPRSTVRWMMARQAPGSATGCSPADTGQRVKLIRANGSAGHGGKPLAGCVGGELVPQAAPSPVQPGHDRPDRGAHDVGDLLVRVPLDVREI